jgi:hypothetical protein
MPLQYSRSRRQQWAAGATLPPAPAAVLLTFRRPAQTPLTAGDLTYYPTAEVTSTP